jgi:hypothetical protein
VCYIASIVIVLILFRRELAALKASTMNILHPETANVQSQSPALMTALAMTPGSFAKPEIKRTSTPITINTRKDIPASPSSRGFWGGNNDPMAGGPTICHTMFTPDLVLPNQLPELPRCNLNPRLNDLAQATPTPHLGNSSNANARDLTDEFSEWSETHPFSLRSMDSYRIQMWSRLAREAAAEKAGIQHDLRPKFYVEPSTPTTTPAQYTNAASSHITSRLASSFWSAFSNPTSQKLDTDKLTAVVLGTSRLKVVDEREEDLVAALGGLKLQSGLGMGGGVRTRENPLGAMASFFKHAGGCPTRA